MRFGFPSSGFSYVKGTTAQKNDCRTAAHTTKKADGRGKQHLAGFVSHQRCFSGTSRWVEHHKKVSKKHQGPRSGVVRVVDRCEHRGAWTRTCYDVNLLVNVWSSRSQRGTPAVSHGRFPLPLHLHCRSTASLISTADHAQPRRFGRLVFEHVRRRPPPASLAATFAFASAALAFAVVLQRCESLAFAPSLPAWLVVRRRST